MNKHTPGPWEVGYCTWNDDGNVCYELRGIKKGFASDARLISAAPDMLEALKVAEQFMSIASDWNIDEAEINGEMRSTYDWIDLVRVAISKATGEK